MHLSLIPAVTIWVSGSVRKHIWLKCLLCNTNCHTLLMCTTESSLAKETVRYNSSKHLFVYTDNVFSCGIFRLFSHLLDLMLNAWVKLNRRDCYYFSLFLRLNAHLTATAVLAGFIAPKDDGSGGDNWSYKMCKVPVKSSPQQTNTQLCTDRMSFLSPNQQCQNTDYCYLYLSIAFSNSHTRSHLPNMIEITTIFNHTLWRHFSVYTVV